ncbi:MAG TPA: recombinase family protein [Clostridia bacterium]|nr:recombinase family protein [Clostridia bacterium]
MVTNIPPQLVNAYNLARFSSTPQGEGTSLERQIERCKAECQRRGWTFNEKLCITDLGVSAFHKDNFNEDAALGQFIKASKLGLLLPNAVLIVENPDRFSRAKLDDADSELWGLVKRGVDVLFLSNMMLLTQGDENDMFKRAILLFEFSRAHETSKRISDLVSAAIARKLAHALTGKAVNFGRIMPKWVSYVGDRHNGVFKLNDRSVDIRRVVELYLSGLSVTRIAKMFNREGIKGLTSKKWTNGQVSHVLHSEALVGTTTILKQRLVGYYPAVITQIEWESLQAALYVNANRKGGQKENYKVVNLFRHRCTCAACGGPASSTKDPAAMRCNYFRTGRGCDVKAWIHNEAIEMDFFGNYLREYPEILLTHNNKDAQRKLNQLREQLKIVEGELEDCVAMIGKLPRHKLDEKQASLNKRKLQLQREIDSLDVRSHVHKAASRAFAEVLKSFDAGASPKELTSASEELWRQLQDNGRREKLLRLIPDLIKGLVLDLSNKRYAIVDLAGNTGEWRDVSGYVISAKRRARKPGQSPSYYEEHRQQCCESSRRHRAALVAKGLRSDGKQRKNVNRLGRQIEAINAVLSKSAQT